MEKKLLIMVIFIIFFVSCSDQKVSIDPENFIYQKGDLDSNIIIYVFIDFLSYGSEGAVTLTEQVLEEYDVKFVFKHFPLEYRQDSFIPLLAVECAGEQGFAEEFAKLLFINNKDLSESNIKWIVKYELDYMDDINPKKFNECLDSKKYLQKVKQNIDEAKSAGIRGVPSFYIDGELIEGAYKKKIEDRIKMLENGDY